LTWSVEYLLRSTNYEEPYDAFFGYSNFLSLVKFILILHLQLRFFPSFSARFEPEIPVIHFPKLSSVTQCKRCSRCFSFLHFSWKQLDRSVFTLSVTPPLTSRFIKRKETTSLTCDVILIFDLIQKKLQALISYINRNGRLLYECTEGGVELETK
jgi:hypothetical protein